MLRDAGYLLLLASIPALVLLHLTIAPYTKVEESFHIQAIHDIETYGIPTRNVKDTLQAEYDHFTFPGAVPRTFAGAIALSGLSSPIIWLKHDIDRQFVGLFNALSLLYFASGLRRAAGKTAAVWYLLFQASQFHVLFYASRTLSNMFAFSMTTFALASLLPEPVSLTTYRKRGKIALYLITIAGIVFRAELALFLATHTLFLLATGRISIQREIIPAGILGLLLGLSITLPVDSFFWQKYPLWPELAAFKFNVVAGQASEWGTHSWHYYFTNALPRLLMNPLTYLIGIPVSLLQPATRRIAASILVPSFAYIAIYSAQPHKEWRFIVYAIPPLTATAAIGTSYIWTHRTKSLIYRFLSLGMIIATLASFILSSFVLLPASSANYPGAHALNTLHDYVLSAAPKTADKPVPISVHLGNLACQTGVTRFLQLPNNQYNMSDLPVSFTYDKSPSPSSLTAKQTFWSRFDYVLLEPAEAESLLSLSGSSTEYAHSQSYAWETVDSVTGFAGLRVVKPGEEARGDIEEKILVWVFGVNASEWGILGLWRGLKEELRSRVTRGWWVEIRMEERIRILERVR
ncbi:dolichyl-P-Man:Man(7)GlcNAc(2)-PP-dolichol alpha-1,6-mannosyltransferase [Aspergillus mulundensis]|uniref:Mannosyltransferase n=1 Tax=Aspergillus mulundensis TaxID=1810919 RepID=A0A3D8T6M5_9EURO|nr:Mannosyltransferase [Aspergillus mulundensis]RDW94203.1 Mannosyltransferase [Aspergillus mulundensis]